MIVFDRLQDTMDKINGNEILYIGHDLNDKGGIATLEKNYAEVIEPYNHISIFKTTTFLKKWLILLEGLFYMVVVLIRNKNIKIVHIQSASGVDFYRNCLPLFIAKIFNKKIIMHIHGGFFAEFCKKKTKITLYFLNKVDSIIVVSKFLQSQLESLNIKVPIKMLYNILSYPDEKKCKVNNISFPIILGFMGAINENKQIFGLVDMFSRYSDLRNYFKLRIAGIGNVKYLKEKIISNNLSEVIEYVGWVKGETKIDFINSFNILVQPSVFESFGLSIAESMSYGKPAIGTNVGGIPEVIENGVNGYLIQPRDWEGLYKLLLYIKDHPNDIVYKGRQAQNDVDKFYSYNIINGLSVIYSDLLN